MSGGGRRVARGWSIAAMLGALAVLLCACGGDSETGRVERSLAGAIGGGTRVECEPQASAGRWWCAIEDDPGSGTSRHLLVRVDGNDCWRAAPTSHSYVIKRCLD